MTGELVTTNPARELQAADSEDPLGPFLTGAISERTRAAYRRDIEGFLAWLRDAGFDDLSGITPDVLLAYRNHLMGYLKPSSVARKLSVLRNFFDFCQEKGVTETNPARARRVRSPKVSSYSTTAGLNQAQAELLLRQPDRSTPMGLRDYALLSLMLHTGLRRSEVVSAKCGDFVTKLGHRVLIVVGKGNKPRDVKIPEKVWRAINEYFLASGREITSDSPLFVPLPDPSNVVTKAIDESPLSAEAIWWLVQKYARQAGFLPEGQDRKSVNITPHSLRHTFITLALAGGAPLHKVQYAAGHSDPRTTERYDRDRDNLDDNATDYVRLRG
ncbi:MAG: tyrosine-type recombinase/integrase [Chloroflexi bacterium]|nr:tyrosine-type recombinase/integrase [Chloroflexota bacterium]